MTRILVATTLRIQVKFDTVELLEVRVLVLVGWVSFSYSAPSAR
jgi:hypothetical protein